MAATKYAVLRPNNRNIIRKDEGEVQTVIAELREKMSRLKFRLLDCQNKNQMLRKEMLLARKVVDTEMLHAPPEDFKELLEQSKSSNFRGRREKILLLKDKLSDLQNRIREIEEGNVVGMQAEPPKAPKVDKDTDQRKPQNRQIMDKELQYLVESSCQMKRKLELWKKRNVELSKEAESLRLELDRLLEKSKEDRTVHESYRVVEKELRARQSEKLDMRSKLDLEKTRNEQLVEELAMLKDDLSLIVSKINDDKVLLDALNNQKGYLQDLLERQKLTFESDLRRFGDDLREVQTKHATNSNILSQLQDIVDEKNQLFQELQTSMESKTLIPSDDAIPEDQVSSVTPTIGSEETQGSEPPQPSAPADDGQAESAAEPSEIEVEITKLKEECEQYKLFFRSNQDEVQRLKSVVLSNKKRLNEWLAQLLQTRSLYAQKNAEVRDLEETSKRLQQPLSSKKKCAESSVFCQTSVDEMKKKSDVLNEEYQFLYSLWEMLMTDKENSLEIFVGYVDCIKRHFVENINNLIQASKAKSNAEEQEQQPETPVES